MSEDYEAPPQTDNYLYLKAREIIEELIKAKDIMDNSYDYSAGMSYRETDEYIEKCQKRQSEAWKEALTFLKKTAL